MNRKELDEAVVYLSSDYKDRKPIVEDLEKGERVVIISDHKDVLSYYGVILEQYGQYNLYLVDNFEEVDEEYLKAVSSRDESKDEAIEYVGKPLSEVVTEVIDSLKLDDNQRRIMSIIKEVMKGGQADVKQEATITLLNDRLRQTRAEKERLEEELKALRTENTDSKSTTQFVKSTINLDTFMSDTQVMYIRDLSPVSYFDTMIKMYTRHLKTIKNKRCKLVVFDNRTFDIKYNDFKKIDSVDTYVSNRSLFSDENPIVCYQVFPMVVDELYKAKFDILILIDRIINAQDLVKGKNVHKYITINDSQVLDYAKNLITTNPEVKLITEKRLNYDQSIIIPNINKSMPDIQSTFYWYDRLINDGEDKRLIFEIFDENNTRKEEVRKRRFH